MTHARSTGPQRASTATVGVARAPGRESGRQPMDRPGTAGVSQGERVDGSQTVCNRKTETENKNTKKKKERKKEKKTKITTKWTQRGMLAWRYPCAWRVSTLMVPPLPPAAAAMTCLRVSLNRSNVVWILVLPRQDVLVLTSRR